MHNVFRRLKLSNIRIGATSWVIQSNTFMFRLRWFGVKNEEEGKFHIIFYILWNLIKMYSIFC